MNYQITDINNPGISLSDKIIKSLLIFTSILYIPVAYLLFAASFIVSIKKFNLNKVFILPFIYIFCGTVLSEYKLISSIFGLMMILCVYAYFIFSISEYDFDIKKSIYLISILTFTIGIMQYLSPDFIMPYKWIDINEYNVSKRIYSTFFNPNIFGFYINFIIILCSENFNFKKINIEWLVYFMGLGCLILTFSRTSWISLILSLLISSLFNKKYLKHALFISIFIVTANFYLQTGRINLTNTVNDSSLLYRLEVWKASAKIFSDNFITGIGFGTLNKYMVTYSNVVSRNIEHTHSIYLQILTETGIVGAIICTYILYNTVRKLFSKIKESNNSIWITAMTVLIMTLIHGIADSVPLTPQIMMLLSIYGGFLSKKIIGDNPF